MNIIKNEVLKVTFNFSKYELDNYNGFCNIVLTDECYDDNDNVNYEYVFRELWNHYNEYCYYDKLTVYVNYDFASARITDEYYLTYTKFEKRKSTYRKFTKHIEKNLL
jgi:hypothetical protein